MNSFSVTKTLIFLLYACTCIFNKEVLSQLLGDQNGDNMLTPTELFNIVDINNDGNVSPFEVKNFMSKDNLTESTRKYILGVIALLFAFCLMAMRVYSKNSRNRLLYAVQMATFEKEKALKKLEREKAESYFRVIAKENDSFSKTKLMIKLKQAFKSFQKEVDVSITEEEKKELEHLDKFIHYIYAGYGGMYAIALLAYMQSPS